MDKGDVEHWSKRDLINEVYRLSGQLEQALQRACALEHPKSAVDSRDDIELFLRDAYAAGANAAHSGSIFTAMEYAQREAPKLRSLLSKETEDGNQE